MKIKPLSTFHVPGIPEFVEGVECEVTEALASTLIERQLVEVVGVAAKPRAEIKKLNQTKE